MKKITLKCNICNNILLINEGQYLNQSDADNYQQNTSCDTDGQTDITAILEEE